MFSDSTTYCTHYRDFRCYRKSHQELVIEICHAIGASTGGSIEKMVTVLVLCFMPFEGFAPVVLGIDTDEMPGM